MIGEKCTTELILSLGWKNGWDFKRQSLMGEYCNMEAFSENISQWRRWELSKLCSQYSTKTFFLVLCLTTVTRSKVWGICVFILSIRYF